ncbi:class I SAM-dependent methyltransferase [Kocuria palustris]|uniref:class I SAM-dependent methyltransferase n=1 Tax=Kocuria palustris TaxID=71999 RepID=UPI003653C085
MTGRTPIGGQLHPHRPAPGERLDTHRAEACEHTPGRRFRPDSGQEVQRRITDYWDQRAREYDRQQHREARVEADRIAWRGILEQVMPAQPQDVLDLGTGSGYMALQLAQLDHRVTGIDLSEAMLGIARDRAAELGLAVEFGLGDAAEPPVAPGSFDVLVSRYLLWTLRSPDDALRAWRRALRPSGLLVAVDGLWFPRGIDANPTPGFREHYDTAVRSVLPLAEARSVEELTERIRAAGFRDVRVRLLEQLWELDRDRGVVQGHDLVPQHLITARP